MTPAPAVRTKPRREVLMLDKPRMGPYQSTRRHHVPATHRPMAVRPRVRSLRPPGARPVHGEHQRQRARCERRPRPRRHPHHRQPGDERPEGAHLVRKRRLHGQPPARCVLGDGLAQGLRQADAEGAQARRRRDPHRGLRPGGEAGGGDHGHRHEARGDGAEHALLRGGTDRRRAALPRRRRPRGPGFERGGLQRPEPGSRPEPGRHAGRLVRPDRPRPAGGQGAGGRLPGRVRHLPLPVHAGHRPLRHVPRRGPARPAGHPVRLRVGVGNRPLHHQPARDRAEQGLRRVRRQLPPRRRLHRRGSARPQREEARQPRRPDRGAAVVLFAPNDRLSITPRFVYQRVNMDGWNRIDVFNILANPYTTTRPAVTLGERQQFTQIPEPYTDDFYLGDLNVNYRFGDVVLTSITSYTYRHVDVIRDAGALTSSITGASIGLPQNVYTLDAPLDDATDPAKAWTEELRLSGGKGSLRWVVGGFYANTKRHYAQSLLVNNFEELSGIPTKETYAPKNVLFWSDLNYKLDHFAAFGEGTWTSNRFSLTGGLRYYHFSEDKAQIFDGIFGDDGHGNAVSQPGTTKANGVAPRLILSYKASDQTNLIAQVSKGFRLGGIDDTINAPLCTPQDLVTFGGREAWKDETAWNYEVGSKSRIMGGRGSFNVSAFYMDVRDLQATVTAGSCSSRVIFNVPKSRSVGGEAELALAPSRNFDFALSASYDDVQLRSTLNSTAPDGSISVVSGIETGERLTSVPRFQMAAAATYQWQMNQGSLGYVTGSFRHIGSRFTQVGDQLLGTLDLTSFGKNTIGGPLTATTFTYDPETPAYDILNLRLGVRRNRWDVSLFGNNLTDERALLALDRERGTRARVGYLTNQPRTFGISARLDF